MEALPTCISISRAAASAHVDPGSAMGYRYYDALCNGCACPSRCEVHVCACATVLLDGPASYACALVTILACRMSSVSQMQSLTYVPSLVIVQQEAACMHPSAHV